MNYQESARFRRAKEIKLLLSRLEALKTQQSNCSENHRSIIDIGIHAIRHRLQELGYQCQREEHIYP